MSQLQGVFGLPMIYTIIMPLSAFLHFSETPQGTQYSVGMSQTSCTDITSISFAPKTYRAWGKFFPVPYQGKRHGPSRLLRDLQISLGSYKLQYTTLASSGRGVGTSQFSKFFVSFLILSFLIRLNNSLGIYPHLKLSCLFLC